MTPKPRVGGPRPKRGRGIKGARPLLRPDAKQIAVALSQSLSLKRGERLAVLIGLSLPHPAHGPPLDAPEPVHQLGVVGKMALQCLPLSCARPFHSIPARSRGNPARDRKQPECAATRYPEQESIQRWPALGLTHCAGIWFMVGTR